MAGPTLIQIKRSQGPGALAAPGSLANGELGYTANGDVLYIGIESAVVPIGGERFPGVLTANQALVTNTTNMIDKIMLGNTTVNTVANSLAFTLANSTVTFSLTKPSAAQVTAGDFFLGADGAWQQPAGSVTALDGLSDVVLTGLANNDFFTYDEAAAAWENHPAGNGFSFDGHSPSILVAAASGLVVNTTGVWVDGANGISVTTDGVNVLATNGMVSNTTGLWLTPGSGLVTNSTGLHVGTGDGVAVDADLVRVVAGTSGGLVSNSTGVWVDAANGIVLSADGVNVLGGVTTTVNTTGIHVNSTLSITSLDLSGDLTVGGTMTTLDATNLQVTDPLIKLANEQADTTSFLDALDIGFVAEYGNTTVTHFTGLFRDTSVGDNRYKFFDSTNDFPVPTTTVDTANVNFALANLEINAIFLSTALVGTMGGTGLAAIAEDSILVGNATNGYTALALGAQGLVLQSTGTALVYDSLDGGTF